MNVQILDITESNAFNAANEKATGTDGVIIKGGQGELSYAFQPFVDQCNAADLPYGIYWLVDARYHSTAHFAEIQKAFPNGFGQLGLWLDWEKPEINMTDAAYNALTYSGYRDCSGLIVLLKQWTNQLKGIYTAEGFWNLLSVPDGLATNQGTAQWFAAQCDLWEAEYGVSTPKPLGAWATYKMWQYQESPDYSIFNGTLDDFNAYFGIGAVVTPPVVPVPNPDPTPVMIPITVTVPSNVQVNVVTE